MNDETTLLKLLFFGSLVAIRICELEDTIYELTSYLKNSMKKEES